MTGDATRSDAWLAGYQMFSVMGRAEHACPYVKTMEAAWFDFLSGWERRGDEVDEARDRAREDRQHYPLSPMSALERNRP